MHFACEETGCDFVSSDSIVFAQHTLTHSSFCFICNTQIKCDTEIKSTRNWLAHIASLTHKSNQAKMSCKSMCSSSLHFAYVSNMLVEVYWYIMLEVD